jgi:ABC-type glycerol-3-phosphate transport system substrate-binding protein
MLQNGVQMTNQEGLATFDRPVSVNGKSVNAGENAWTFYTDFARIGSPVYTWNSSLHYSIDSFFEGTAAMMLSYSYNIDTIKSKNAKLNFAIAPVPQYSGQSPIDYSNYWGFAVAKNKVAVADKNAKVIPPPNNVRVREAWEFLKTLTTQNSGKLTLVNMISGANKTVNFNFDPAKFYTDDTKKPAARRDLIDKQKTDPLLGPFAYGNLIAKSWQQSDPDQIETILSEAIDSINKGNTTVSEALRLASTRVGQLVKN